MVTAAKKLKDNLLLGRTRQHMKKQRHHFTDKGPYSQSYGFSSSMYGCKSQTINNAEREELMLFNCGVGEDS